MDVARNHGVAGGHDFGPDELIPFGKYLLLNRINVGATSAVYRAKAQGEAGFEKVVAVKRILPQMAGDADFVRTFVREAKTAARLGHANICPIFELGKVGESLYIAMEYVPGKDLGSVCRRLGERNEPMPPMVAAWVVSRLCEALDYAHQLRDAGGHSVGIIHRDLSPTNILLSYEGEVKLIDFGLAKASGRATQTNVDALKQKLSYMSPEMVKGKPLDARTDIFGVGVCLYEMLTGQRAFAGKNEIDTLKKVGLASFPPPSAISDEIPEELETIIMRALEREPEDRWQTAGEMHDALDAYVMRENPTYSPRKLAAWMHEHFEQDIEREQERLRRLLDASNRPGILEERKQFFMTAAGAMAAAKVGKMGRTRSVPPRTSDASGKTTDDRPTPLAPRPAGVPQESGMFEDQTMALDENDIESDEGFGEAPTNFYIGSPDEFDEEATEIYFSNEEDVDLAEMPPLIAETEAAAAAPARASTSQPAGGQAPAPPSPGALGRDNAQSMPPAPRPAHPQQGMASIPPAAPVPSQPAHGARPSSPAAPGPRRGGAVTQRLPAYQAPSQRGRGRRRLLMALAWVLTAVIVGAGTFVVLRMLRVGAMEIRTSPEVNAAVLVDGVHRGRTPLRIEDLPAGRRHVVLQAAGYEDVSRVVELESRSTTMLDVSMRPVDSKPRAEPAEPSRPSTPE